MDTITIVSPIYNPSKRLIDSHIENWLSWSDEARRKTNIILVDDYSNPLVDFTISANINLTIARITEDKAYNIGGAKNLGLHLSKTKFTLQTDIDHFITAQDLDRLFAFEPKDNEIYKFQRTRLKADGKTLEKRHPHANSYILSTELFWKAGGFDEDMSGPQGYGFEDALLLEQFQRLRIDFKLLNITLLEKEEFMTPNIDRSTSRNLRIWNSKRNKEYRNGPVLRFSWDITKEIKYV